MSLKAERSDRQGSFRFWICKQQAGKWETWFSFSTFPRFAGTVGMWKSRSVRFPRTVGAEENLLSVFLGVHGPAFPQSFPFRPIVSGRLQNSRITAVWLP